MSRNYIFLSAVFALIVATAVYRFQGDSGHPELKKFHVVGHGYGSHHKTNKGLDDNLLKFIGEYSPAVSNPLFFAGDFIRECTAENWDILIDQFTKLKINPFLVRGSHERTKVCISNLKQRHDSLNYSVEYDNALVLVVDSRNRLRVFSDEKLSFINNSIAKSKHENIFIITHFLVWLSNIDRYGDFKANMGSRYNMVKKSNYWSKLHPILMESSDKRVYFIAGDMGGRPDSEPAHFDQVDNITFVGSGLGEIELNAVLEVSIEGKNVILNLVSIEPPHRKTSIIDFRWPE